jgi:hypothetical protein
LGLQTREGGAAIEEITESTEHNGTGFFLKLYYSGISFAAAVRSSTVQQAEDSGMPNSNGRYTLLLSGNKKQVSQFGLQLLTVDLSTI